ncbi:MAG TPA: hypothetical protein GXX50_04715 [Firmicutes bacterium]|uniref:hypothetical protein n=1 Tax=Gelria sp. Kuro-4 TaxID=2796927 RepID=UPI0019A15EBE|nr:hypothetical protein [Gelria sp. Kuro-4]BCV24750.1 hypothetical protein kuro4_15230 [Gelria sp. Kuro-4]HHV57050.1 hypothetical protein [Bacillota bacterium]
MSVMSILRLAVHLLFLAFFYRFLYSIVKAIERDLAAAGTEKNPRGGRREGPAGE